LTITLPAILRVASDPHIFDDLTRSFLAGSAARVGCENTMFIACIGDNPHLFTQQV
jgi:hypothetical protein